MEKVSLFMQLFLEATVVKFHPQELIVSAKLLLLEEIYFDHIVPR